MSYPLHKSERSAPTRLVCSELGFWGLDLSGGAFKEPIRRALDTENMMWAGDALKRRPGYKCVSICEDPIFGIYFYGNERIIHAGTHLYCQIGEREYITLYDEMNYAPSMGVVRHQTVEHRWCNAATISGWHRSKESRDILFINDGTNYLFYDGELVRPVMDPNWGESLRSNLANGRLYSFFSTVPISAHGKKPTGENGDMDPRGDNRLSQFRCESFYLDDQKEYNEFVLGSHYSKCNSGIPPELQIRDSNGVWRNYCCAGTDTLGSDDVGRAKITIEKSVKGGMKISCSSDGRVTSAGSGTEAVAHDGLDNLRITYAVFKDKPEALIGATVQGLYGADGSDNVLFLGGNDSAPGVDAFSARDDFFCFYTTSTERLGNEQIPITGYCHLSDGRMAVLKNDPNDSNVYFRSHTVVSVGTTYSGEAYHVDAFPSKTGAAVEGCLTPHSVGIAGNEPIFLAKSGLYSVRSVSNELTNLNETIRRSVPVDPFLSAQDPSKIRSIGWNGCYLIVCGKEALITDGRRDSKGMLRFLKWRFAHEITALGKNGNILYLGDFAGRVYQFGSYKTDDGEKITAFWHTCLPEDKGGRRQILKQISAAMSPDYDGALSAVVYQEKMQAPEVYLTLNRVNFVSWDFSAVTFEGVDAMRWLDLPVSIGVADRYEIRMYLHSGSDLLLWGLRMNYEKGGIVR